MKILGLKGGASWLFVQYAFNSSVKCLHFEGSVYKNHSSQLPISMIKRLAETEYIDKTV